jgi:dihydrofolate reductase
MTATTSRKMIAALQVSLDGLTRGPNGEADWVDSWADAIALVPEVDTFVLGGRMYPDYGEYWRSIDTDSERIPPYGDRLPSEREIAYARFAARTPHVVLSRTLKGDLWPSARIVDDVAELRALKGRPGKNFYVVGGATLVASLLNEGLIDEIRLIVRPVVLGEGQALFDGVTGRHSLELVGATTTESGCAILTYRVRR